MKMINKDLFIPLEREILQVQKKEETLGYWQDAWIRLKKNKGFAGINYYRMLNSCSYFRPYFFYAILMMNRI